MDLKNSYCRILELDVSTATSDDLQLATGIACEMLRDPDDQQTALRHLKDALRFRGVRENGAARWEFDAFKRQLEQIRSEVEIDEQQ